MTMTSATPPIAPLFEGPLDIVGDVHGEVEVLESLLSYLGYDAQGDSADGRRLVFLGDLIDRGPDSPAVVDKVMSLVGNGKAQCLMGNHELNILLNRPLPGNGWLIQPNHLENPGEFRSRPVDPEKLQDYLQFFSSLPLALENESLRLTHACWHAQSVAQLREPAYSELSITDLYRRFDDAALQEIHASGLQAALDDEVRQYGVALEDPEWQARLLPAHAKAEVLRHMWNPVRVLTTSEVRAGPKPFFIVGLWRMIERTRWWDYYDDDIPVVIGHFWRRFSAASERISGIFGRDVFEGIPTHAWMGKRKNVYCVDYSVGQLHAERRRDPDPVEFHGKLAALRYPEWEVHHHDGTVIPVV